MKIGVIGAGTIVRASQKGILHRLRATPLLCATSSRAGLRNARQRSRRATRSWVARRSPQEKADAIVAAITPGLKEDLCADCDLIVEAAFEDMKVKQTTFGELDKICKPECIFASNTSSLSITEIGKGLSRPLVGMHFFNPADRMKLIEVIAGCNTPAETVEKIKEISVTCHRQEPCSGQRGWVGFVVNRILIPNDQRGCLH